MIVSACSSSMMSGLGRYPLNIPSLSSSFSTNFQNFQQGSSNSGQRRDRLDYDDRRYRDRGGDSRRDDFRQRDSSSRRQRERFSPEPSYSYSEDRRQGGQSNLVSYPLGHLDNPRSDRNSDRGDRNRYQNRDRYRNSGRSNSNSNNRGSSSNQGPGILGAKPGDRSVPELPTSGLSALGLSGNAGLTAQLAQQQQQLMAMVQTQSLLAAMQAQANVQARIKPPMPNPLGLLPTPLIPRNRDMQRQNRKRKMDGYGGGGNFGNKRERFDRNRGQQGNRPRQWQNQQNRGKQDSDKTQNQQPKKTATAVSDKAAKKEAKEVESEEEEEEDVEEEEEVTEETLQGDNNEEEESAQEEEKQEHDEKDSAPVEPEEEVSQPPLPKAVNFVGEDVDSMMVSLFDTKRGKYICQECKIISNKAQSFHGHLMGKRHAKTVLEKQGKVFDANEFKNFCSEEKPAVEKAVKPEEPAPMVEESKVVVPEITSPTPSQSSLPEALLDFVRYTCDTRKSAMKEGNIVTISSVTEARVRIEGFTSGRDMLGCEFVKAVSGFNCRLCKAFIRCGNDVINHIKGKKHQKNYQAYVQEHPQYEKHQLARNKELESVLEPKEGEEVVLYEVLDEDIRKSNVKPRRRRKDSHAVDHAEVQITKFVPAPQSTEEAEQLKKECDIGEISLDLEGVELLHDGSLFMDGIDEQYGKTTLTEEEENSLLKLEEEEKPAEVQAMEEFTSPPPLASESNTPLQFEELEKSEEESPVKSPVPVSPKLADAKKIKEELVEADTSVVTAEPASTPSKASTPSARRGRKGGPRVGATRGKGRGRVTKRSVRATVGSTRVAKIKQEKAEDDTEDSADVGFMESFEVIDEIGDGED